MSRNGSGTYTLPSGNPVVSGTLIESAWANNTLSDIATALTDSLSRSGQGSMTAAFRAYDGTSTVPGIAWGSETTTGFYRAGAADTRLVVTGSEVMKFLATGVAVTGTLSGSGNFAINTDKFTVAASSGNTVVAGTLGVTGNLAVNTDKFTVAASSGNTVVAGTLGVTGAATLSSTLNVTGASTFSGQTVTLSNATAYYPQLINRNTTNDANASYVVLDKVRGTSVVQNGDVLGNLIFRGYDGAAYLQGAAISAVVSAAPGTNDMPADLVLSTTADGASAVTERMRITNVGDVYIRGGKGLAWYDSTNTGYWAQYNSSGALLFSNGTERMRLDSAGNLGLGVTPSAWSTLVPALQLGGGGTFLAARSTSPEMYIGTNAHYNGTNWLYKTSAVASMYAHDTGIHKWFTAPSGTAGNAITFTQAMTLDASGNLLVGSSTSPATVWSGSRTFSYVKGNASGNGGEVIVESNNGNQQASFFASAITAEFGLWSTKASALLLGTNNTERARINSSGNLTAFCASTSDPFYPVSAAGAGTSRWLILGSYGATSTTSTGTNSFGVFTNGNVVNTNNSYGTLSDIKLKENIVDASPKLDDVLRLRVRNFNLKADQSHKQIGFIAQEFEEVFPAMVDETPDRDKEGNETGEVTKSIKSTVLIPILVKAIQEQQAMIVSLKAELDSVKAELAALKAKA